MRSDDRRRPAGTTTAVTPLPRRPDSALYRLVKDYVLERIASGQWAAGARVPSENSLIRTLGVSKMTVNRALRELTTEGVLTRRQGIGTFVAPPRAAATLLEVCPIADEIARQGGRHSCVMHLNAREAAAPDLALALALPPGAEVFHTILVHADHGRPIQLEDRYVNPAAAPAYLDVDFTTITPSRYLLNEIPVSEVEHVVEAVLPDRRTCELLRIGPQEPCIVLYRRTWSGSRVVTRCRLIHPGSRYRIGGRFRPASAAHAVEA